MSVRERIVELPRGAALPNLPESAGRRRPESADTIVKRPTKKRKAFRTSPSIRIPRAAVQKLQESKAQAQAQAQEITRLETSVKAMGKALEKAIDAYARRHKMLYDGLRDLMRYFDKVNASKGEWTVADVKRIEEIRLLSLGI